ncbi:MAG: hypothetical protein DLM69_05870 [Candidatus Chloroheliales bacterium]|nr:MAG: hypothetical protein DLM69_05870 [Chloroflexota bacterium]
MAQMNVWRSVGLVLTTDTDQQFELIFNRYGSLVYAMAKTLLNNEQDAEDAVQEVFIRVHRALDSYDAGGGSIEGWLRTILLNYCRDKWRRRGFLSIPMSVFARSHEGEEGSWEEALGRVGGHSDEDSAPDADLLRREDQSELWAAVNRLSEKLRRVVVLRYYMGMSCSEVADALGVPPGTVYSRLDAARSELLRLLGGR